MLGQKFWSLTKCSKKLIIVSPKFICSAIQQSIYPVCILPSSHVAKKIGLNQCVRPFFQLLKCMHRTSKADCMSV